MDKTFETRQIGYVKELQGNFKPRFSIKFQFDMYHGIGNLDKAIELLPEKDKQDFSDYVRKKQSLVKVTCLSVSPLMLLIHILLKCLLG